MGKAVQAVIRSANLLRTVATWSLRQSARHKATRNRRRCDHRVHRGRSTRIAAFSPKQIASAGHADMERSGSGAASTWRKKPVTVASFRGPPKRLYWAVLPNGFRQDVEDYLSWANGSDPFHPDARLRPLAPGTLRLRRDQSTRLLRPW